MRRIQGHILFPLAAVLGLTGCLGEVTKPSTVALSPFWLNASAPRAVRSDGVIIAGPAGFCIDPGATRSSDGVQFALLGSCASLANSAEHGRPRQPAMLTASVAPPGGLSVTQNSDALVRLLSGAQGQALLSNESGVGVTVADVGVTDNVIVVHARDPGLTGSRGLPPDYWRGFFDLNGRVVTLSVFSPQGRSLSDRAGATLLQQFVAAMREANTESDAVVARARR